MAGPLGPAPGCGEVKRGGGGEEPHAGAGVGGVEVGVLPGSEVVVDAGEEGEGGEHLGDADLAVVIAVDQRQGLLVERGAVDGAAQRHPELLIELVEGDRFSLGEPSGARTPRLEALSQALIEAGFKAPIRPKIRDEIWVKLWGNLTFNPVAGALLVGAQTPAIANSQTVIHGRRGQSQTPGLVRLPAPSIRRTSGPALSRK